MEPVYHFFIAGIIQGSKHDLNIHNQEYRLILKDLLNRHFPGSDVFCPAENHPNSTSYDDQKARNVFFEHLDIVRGSHCLVVYLPEASLGSAVEMWEAFQQKIPVVVISPMETNWVIRILSDAVCAGIDDFIRFVEGGRLSRLLKEKLSAE